MIDNLNGYYIKDSSCATNRNSTYRTTSVSVGLLSRHKNGRTKYCKALKRFKYCIGDLQDRDRAVLEAAEWIKGQKE